MATDTKNTAPATETPAAPAPVEPRKSSQVSATVPAEYFDGLEDYRWTVRKKMTEIVKEALDAYVTAHDIKVDGSAPHA